MTIEKRYQPRVELVVQAEIRYRGRCFPARTCNVSAGGICLESRGLRLVSGMLLQLELHLSSHRWQIAGIVVHNCIPRFGLLFRVPQPELLLAAIGEPIELPATPPAIPAQVPIRRY